MMRAEHKLSEEDLKFLVTGGIAVGDPEPNPYSGWLVDKSWGEIGRMSKLDQAHGFKKDFETYKDQWQEVFQSSEPFNMLFPGKWNDCASFTRLMIMRCIRPDKLVPATMSFVAKEMGQKFIEPPPLDLEACYQDSNPCSPLIFILSAGSDPNAALFKLADEKGFGETMKSVSLGQVRLARCPYARPIVPWHRCRVPGHAPNPTALAALPCLPSVVAPTDVVRVYIGRVKGHLPRGTSTKVTRKAGGWFFKIAMYMVVG
jgi:hypothetical protein